MRVSRVKGILKERPYGLGSVVRHMLYTWTGFGRRAINCVFVQVSGIINFTCLPKVIEDSHSERCNRLLSVGIRSQAGSLYIHSVLMTLKWANHQQQCQLT